MKIEVLNLDSISKAYQKRADKMERKLASSIKTEANQIKARTQSGIDVFGAPFKPYSLYWAIEREQRGLQSSYVDLTFTGDMFRAMKTRVQKLGNKIIGTIYFDSTDAQDKAYSNEKLGRYFFALNQKQAENIRNNLRSP